ncbi:MAG: peptidase M3 [Planctomycetes bacterium]|nr:peptidase M3 [Planctomycetota bacterium]
MSSVLDDLNATFLRLHTTKENAFWAAYMGLEDDPAAARAELDRREVELNRFSRDAANLRKVREALAAPGLANDARVALEGWQAYFSAHALEGEASQTLAEEIVGLEGELAKARGAMQLGYVDPERGFQPASSVKLGTLLRTDPNPALRKAAWEGLRSIEDHVLAHGFAEVVKRRNELGRAQGAEDYYDYKVKNAEGMSKREVFALLDELEARTRDAARAALARLEQEHGADAVTPWNVGYLISGDVTRELDPYFPFEESVARWGRSFAALGIDYRGASMVLDLIDRKGKYENGFMHGPEPAWRKDGALQRARIQFTANAIPGMLGSGQRATQTLFHEGGHAAHFANVDMPAPCFGQEFAPTSVAFAETQSMFLDSLLGDADWKTRYAKTRAGEPIPAELIEKDLRAKHPFAAWSARAMLAVCYAERAIYELPEAELTAAGILGAIRAAENRMLFMDSSRPVLSVPHLLAGESSAYYHGYVMALMGVHQTRAFFLERDGHLVDNPKIGPDLARAYWRPGNSRRCSDLIQALTGDPLSPKAYADHLVRDTEELVAEARARRAAEAKLPRFSGPVRLNASIRVANGKETVCELAPDGDFDAFAEAFGGWIGERASAPAS